jgi:hypothetical protein
MKVFIYRSADLAFVFGSVCDVDERMSGKKEKEDGWNAQVVTFGGGLRRIWRAHWFTQ